MNKEALVQAMSDVCQDWEAVIAELGNDGLERAGATGDWRVRDVLAHFNGWEQWQLVQLRCAFTGETPTDHELTGGIEYPPSDSMHPDAINAMFVTGMRVLPVEDILSHWRKLSASRADWVSAASQEQLDAVVGSDWTGGSPRIVRLTSEVPSVSSPVSVWQFIFGQIEHQKQHLQTVREWMTRERNGLLDTRINQA